MSTVASWTVLESVVSFADPWLRVRSDRIRTASGDVFGPYHILEYPDWVTIVPFVQDSFKLLLVREYRHGAGTILSGLPGGTIDPGDGAESQAAARNAAEREVLEETGYGQGRLEHLVSLHPNPSNQSNVAHCFLATGLSRVGLPQPGGPGESQDVIESDLIDVLAAARDGAFVLHAIHAAALWSAAARIANDQTERFSPLTCRLRQFLSGVVGLTAQHPAVGG